MKAKLFLTSSASTVMTQLVKDLPKPANQLKMLFIYTAAEVEIGDKAWLHADRDQVTNTGITLTDFTLTGKTVDQVKAALDSVDGVFVAGGNTFFLLQEIRKSGFEVLIKEKLTGEYLYIGSSAGSVAAGPNIEWAKDADDPADAPELTHYQGMNLVDVAIVPHWGSEFFENTRQELFANLYQTSLKIVLLNDHQYLVSDGKTFQIKQTT